MAYLNESHIEVADINFFTNKLGYTHIDTWEKKLLGRKNLKEVVLKDRLKKSLLKLNEHIPPTYIDYAISEISSQQIYGRRVIVF